MKRVRRVISHHGSDCPDGPHPFKENRCLILARHDRDDGTSEIWVSGDCAETIPVRCKLEDTWRDPDDEIRSERLYRKRQPIGGDKTAYYGGGFWERVTIEPKG